MSLLLGPGPASSVSVFQSLFEANMRLQSSELDKSSGYHPKLLPWTVFTVCAELQWRVQSARKLQMEMAWTEQTLIMKGFVEVKQLAILPSGFCGGTD